MKKTLILGALAAIGATGCVAPRVLTSEDFVGSRSVKYTLRSTGGAHYDYSVRICDFDQAGNEANCNDSLLIDHVLYRPNIHHF